MEETRVAAKLVEDETSNQSPLRLGQERPRPVQMGERPATVDVRDQKHHRPPELPHPHVGHIDVPQIELGRAAGPFGNHQLELRLQGAKRGLDRRPQRRRPSSPRRATQLAIHLPHHHDLTAHVPLRLHQHRVHAHIRYDTGGQGL